MTESSTQLEQAIQQAAGQYFQLVIIVGAHVSGKTAVLQTLAQKLRCPLVNVNLELSKRMLELTRTQRSRQVERQLKEVVAAVPGDVVLLDNLEILFDTSLEVEPLRMVQATSRNPRQWRSFVDQPQTQAEVDAIRSRVNRGTSSGNENCSPRPAARLQLQQTLRPRGRPKKQQLI